MNHTLAKERLQRARSLCVRTAVSTYIALVGECDRNRSRIVLEAARLLAASVPEDAERETLFADLTVAGRAVRALLAVAVELRDTPCAERHLCLSRLLLACITLEKLLEEMRGGPNDPPPCRQEAPKPMLRLVCRPVVRPVGADGKQAVGSAEEASA
jgi:hypothetical protein